MTQDNLRRYAKPSFFSSNRNEKEKPEKRNAKDKREVQRMLGKLKEESGCVDCSVTYPFYILDFDHVRGKKVANIGQMLDYFSVADIMKEVAKCDIVCSNCHRERTYQRKQEKP